MPKVATVCRGGCDNCALQKVFGPVSFGPNGEIITNSCRKHGYVAVRDECPDFVEARKAA